MRRQMLARITGVLLIATGALGGTAFAFPSGAVGVRAASAALDPVEKTQYYLDGYYWC